MPETTIENFANYLLALQSQGIFLISKIIFIILSLLFLVGIIYFLRASGYFKIRLWQDVVEFFTYKPYGVEQISKRWQKIQNRLTLPSEAEYKLAILEAEDILDNILKRMGYSGETLGDKLNLLSPAQLPNISQVLEAHKVRNNIIHDPDYRLSLDRTRKLLEVYEKAFQELQAL